MRKPGKGSHISYAEDVQRNFPCDSAYKDDWPVRTVPADLPQDQGYGLYQFIRIKEISNLKIIKSR